MFKFLVIIFYVLSLLAALNGAFCWWRSTRTTIDVSHMPPERHIETYVLGLHFERRLSSWLNEEAAISTAIAAVLAFVGAVLSLL